MGAGADVFAAHVAHSRFPLPFALSGALQQSRKHFKTRR
jgi:hypothetical protein